jgi:hypothetical protein
MFRQCDKNRDGLVDITARTSLYSIRAKIAGNKPKAAKW